MNGTLQKRVLETIDRHSMIRPGDRVGVGVSGGADSVALFRLFSELRAALGIEIFVLHFNHQLRGAEADENERFVCELAAAFGIESVCDRADVAGEARRGGLNLEDAGRRLRYQFFASVGVSRGLKRVAVAHTIDDQAETVLSHFLRGTGFTGLAGIYPIAGVIVRPLLEIRRGELRDYLSGLRQDWREDATNQDTSHTRARIRHQLLPLLARDFNPAVVMRLANMGLLAREEENFWAALEEDRMAALTARESSSAISVLIADLLAPLPLAAAGGSETNCKQPLSSASTVALTRRLVRRICAELRGSRQRLTARHIQNVIDLATKSQSGARIALPGVVVERSFNRLLFSDSKSADQNATGETGAGSEFEYALSSPGPSQPTYIAVPEIRRRFTLKVIDWPPPSRETSSPRGTLDFDRLRWPMVLRNWRPGDSYRPCGRKHIRKLKRLFLESRIPLGVRTGWPVLTSDERLVWASGYPVAEEYAPRAGTRTGLVIAEEEI